MSEGHEFEYGLVMPFVTVASKGGPHDDNSYTAGWEMGELDGRLKFEQPAIWTQTIRADNEPQADLLAMKNGYSASIEASEVDGWSFLTLTRTQAEVQQS